MTTIDVMKSTAEGNDPGAQYDLALHYLSGPQPEVECREAARWLQRSAQSGHPRAQVELSKLYIGGWGVDQDFVEAYRWIETAYMHHLEKIACDPPPVYYENELALQNLSEMKRWLSLQMTLDQIIEGQRRAIGFLSTMKTAF
jgi:TPR repeat protein